MSAEDLTRGLHGKWSGSRGMAKCPAHNDRTPSLSISDGDDGQLLVHCHAECSQDDVIAALKDRGLWPDPDNRWDGPAQVAQTAQLQEHSQDNRRRQGLFIRPRHRRVGKDKPDRDDAKRTQAALRIWQASVPASGTLVETYLQSRSLHFRQPQSIRFHAGLKHPTGGIWPAMVALVTRGTDDAPLAIHRTFLAQNGAGKAPVEPQKMMLGPCHGGAVRLDGPDDVLMVGEGIETCLAVMQATGRPAWAALSTSGLRCLDLPDNVREVIVLADGDDPGEAAARDAALRWKRDGRSVRIARPPRGSDFNDLLTSRSRNREDVA